MTICCDSGATDHFFSQHSLFDKRSFSQVVKGQPVFGSVNDTKGAVIAGRGLTVPIEVTTADGDTCTVQFDANFVPDLAPGLNVMSTSRLTHDASGRPTGHSVTLGHASALILRDGIRIPLNRQDGLTVLNGRRQLQHRRHHESTLKPAPRALATSATTLYDLHLKLNHLNYDDVERVAQQQDIDITDTTRKFCEHCQIGKQTRKQARIKLPTAATARPQSIVHTDIFGPVDTERIRHLSVNKIQLNQS